MKYYSPKLLVFIALCGLFASGCGKPTGTITGQVTLDGQPLPDGEVTFANENMQVWKGMITNGQYQVEEVELGPKRVTVFSYPPKPKMPEAAGTAVVPIEIPDPDKDKFAIPKMYNDVTKSGLTHEVVAGPQTYDIPLSKKAK